MKRLMLVELREKVREIRMREQDETPAQTSKARKQIAAAVQTLLRLSRVSRKDGLLALECETEQLTEELFCGEHLKELIDFVIDGTEPEVLEEIGLQKYFARDMKDYEGFTYLIFLKGTLALCRNDCPRCVEMKLRSMLTAEMEEVFLREEQRRMEQERNQKPDLSKVAVACAATYQKIDTDESGEVQNSIITYAEHLILHTSNQDLQRLLRETENRVLKVAMKGFGKAAREHIFENMSKRLAVLIAEEMMLEGEVGTQEIVTANQQIVDTWHRLSLVGEVTDTNSDTWWLTKSK